MPEGVKTYEAYRVQCRIGISASCIREMVAMPAHGAIQTLRHALDHQNHAVHNSMIDNLEIQVYTHSETQ
jgi:hypothetical protein